MAKKMSLLFLTLSVFMFNGQTNAVSFVNNATMPSDILTTIFFNEIQYNSNLFNITAPNIGVSNAGKCILALKYIVSRFPSMDVLPFIDSWGKLPSGLLYGHYKDMGNFDQCTRISKKLNTAIGLVNGQYCTASIPVVQNQAFKVTGLHEHASPINERGLIDLLAIKIAICAPDSCDPSLLEVILQRAANQVFNGALSGITVGNCITAKKPDFEAISIFGIVVFSIFGVLLVLSTIYDAYMEYLEKPSVPLLLAFSALTNGRKLFTISTTKSANSIDCLTGIRVFSMAWVIYCHNYSMFSGLLLINYVDYIPWSKAASSMHVLMGTVSVDTFIFLSGLLIAWIGFRELDKRKGKLNVPMMYLHRFIRLTPAVAAVILFYVSIDKYIGSGPFREKAISLNDDCRTNWWSTLLYVQNYVHPDHVCITQSWYLAVDTQLYVLSPLILIPLWKWGRKFVPVMFVLSILSIGCVIATYFVEEYNFFLDTGMANHTRLVYIPTHTRYSVWLIAIGLGYFMHKNKNKPMRPSKLVQLLGWIVCFTTMLAVIYGPYFTINADRKTTVAEAAIYEALKRPSWAIALSWLVFACHFGFGGIINSFLSHHWWQPLGRLTYSMYLIHLAVLAINFGIVRTDVYFSDYTMITLFWSTFGTSLVAAIILTLTFESPVLVIEKALLGGGGFKQKDTSVDSTGKRV